MTAPVGTEIAAGPHETRSGRSALPEADEATAMMRIEANGLVFDARTAGPEDGEAVILLHGFPQSSYEWRHQIGALAADGFRVIAPDQRGYSPDARPPEVAEYASARLVQDVFGHRRRGRGRAVSHRRP